MLLLLSASLFLPRVATACPLVPSPLPSQEKYVKKKERKHCPVLRVVRPTAATVCEAYCASKPQRVWGLRWDVLSLLLGAANVGANAEVRGGEGGGGGALWGAN